MNYEQKYNEFLEWARKYKAKLNGVPIEEVLPEFKESEDERIRRKMLEHFRSKTKETWCNIPVKDIIAYLEKQKENVEKEYVFRPLAGTDITIAAEQAIRRAEEGDRLVLAFNGAYIPVRKGCTANKIVDIYDTIIEKQKEQIPYTDFVIKPHKGDDTNPYDMSVSEAQEYAIKRGFGVPFNDGEVYVDERHLTQTIGNILRWADEHPKEPHYTKRNALFDKCVENCDPEVMKKVSDEVDEVLEKEQRSTENEDERIRKWLVDYISNCPNNNFAFYGGVGKDAVLNYLEKHKETLHIPETCKKNPDSFTHVPENGETGTQEQKPAEWSEEDEEMVTDIIASIDTNIAASDYHEMEHWLKSLRPQSKKELSIEKAIQWLDDTFCFLDNSSGRGIDYEITTHDFDSLEEMYDSFRKAVIVDSEPHWKPSEEQMEWLETAYRLSENKPSIRTKIKTLIDDLKKL